MFHTKWISYSFDHNYLFLANFLISSQFLLSSPIMLLNLVLASVVFLRSSIFFFCNSSSRLIFCSRFSNFLDKYDYCSSSFLVSIYNLSFSLSRLAYLSLKVSISCIFSSNAAFKLLKFTASAYNFLFYSSL